MLKFIDEKGIEHLVQAEIKASNGVNGERSISGEIHSNDIVIHAIGRGWKLEFENEFYCITYAYPDDDGKDVIVEFDAIHQFFYDFEKSVVYKELNGSNTFDAYLHFIFDGTDYSYRVETEVAAFEKQSFGMRNRLSLFNDIINSVGVEYVVSGKVIRVVEKVGTDLSTIVRKGFNLQDLKLEHNIGNFITYKKGYGAFIDPDDETKGRLEVEYRSPLADVYGELEGDPIIDERYTIEENLFERLKNEVDNSYSISVSLSMEDLTEAGYEQERPHAGDYIMAINEDVGFEEKVRIVSFTSSFDVDGGLIGHQVTCNSISMANRLSKGDKAWKSQVEANLEHAVTSAEYAAISADGKNMTFTGLFGADGTGEPKATKTGDTWYRPNGEETDVYRWDGQAWVFLMSTKDNKIIQEKIEEVEGEVEKSKQTSEEALSEAEISREEARQAKQQAFNSEQLANSAKQDAITAIQKGDQNSTQITTLEGQQKLTNNKVEGNTANILNLQTDSEKLSLSIGKVQSDVENINVGSRNYLLKTDEPKVITGVAGAKSYSLYPFTTKTLSNFCGGVYGESILIAYKWRFISGEKTGSFQVQFNGQPYGTGNTVKVVVSENNTSGFVVTKTTSKENWDTLTSSIGLRTDDLLCSIEISEMRLLKSNTLSDWSLSPEERLSKSEFATFEASYKGFQQTVSSDITGLQSQQTQMDGQISSVVKDVNGLETEVTQLHDQITQTVSKVEIVDGKVTSQQSQITQLSNNISLKVDKDNAIAQINLSPESIRLDAKFIHLSGTSKIDDAIIKSAMIDSVIANKINTGTLNASNVDIINMNASNIVTGTISGANLRINLNTGEVLFNKGIIKKADDSFIMDLDKGYITNKDPSRLAYFLIKDGGVKFYDRNIFSTTVNPVQYGAIMSERQTYQTGELTKDGEIMILQGKNGVTLQTSDFDRTAYFGYNLGNTLSTYRQTEGNYIHVDGGDDWNNYNRGEIHLFSQRATHITSGSFGGYSNGIVDGRSGLHLNTTETTSSGSTITRLIGNWYQRNGTAVTTKYYAYLTLDANGGSTLSSPNLSIKAPTGDLQLSGKNIFISAPNDLRVNASNTTISGNFRVTGTKNAIHNTSLGWVETPAYETAESYLGDIGTETTGSDGTAIIFIDKLFNETVNTKEYDYQVFLQSYSFGSNVFVTVRNEKYFIVKSDKPITSFAYEIKAKRKGYETDRLNQYKLEEELQHVA